MFSLIFSKTFFFCCDLEDSFRIFSHFIIQLILSFAHVNLCIANNKYRKMRKFLPLLILIFAPAAKADITHKLSSSVQLQVNAAATNVERVGNLHIAFQGTTLQLSTHLKEDQLQTLSDL